MFTKIAYIASAVIFFWYSFFSYAQSDTDNISFGTGKVQVEIFTDFQCPACIRFHQIWMPVIESFLQQGKITITYYQYPLTMLHKNAYQDALSAFCAYDQWIFKEYSHAIFELEDSRGWLRISLLDRMKLFISVWWKNISSFRSCLISRKYKKKIENNIAYGDSKDITWVPSVFINGNSVDNQILFQENSLRELLLNYLK